MFVIDQISSFLTHMDKKHSDVMAYSSNLKYKFQGYISLANTAIWYLVVNSIDPTKIKASIILLSLPFTLVMFR